MKDILLDTNVYGNIIGSKDQDMVKEKLRVKKGIIIFGATIIWKELKDIPKAVRIEERSLRLLLLGLYKRLVDEEIVVAPEMIKIADDYYKVYHEIGGNTPRSRIISDFVIVACASVKDLDIVVSEDEKSMKNRTAIKAYKIVNKIQCRSTPNFISYEGFRRLLAL